jgi:hypothetical protein
MKVEEGSTGAEPNRPSAESGAALRAYFARKRLIAMRSSWFLTPLAILLAFKGPTLGVLLVIGGICGIMNILAIMQSNERLLDGRRSRAAYVWGNMIRVLAFGAIPVFAIMHGPLWTVGIYFAGFFTPLVLYAIELQRNLTRGL